ncbi:hypothetical protein CDAR_47521 [Caerostris darwini]|uniref:Uncharacterized protein n=1 Tax=Caerostris darwini TaxID=1538125 RepID=A0AAV4M875_9ARAC|nr:hypothetical protein CDAR_47521 [Caerostris darwini]
MLIEGASVRYQMSFKLKENCAEHALLLSFPCPDGCNESDPSDREQGIPLLTGLREKLTSFGKFPGAEKASAKFTNLTRGVIFSSDQREIL